MKKKIEIEIRKFNYIIIWGDMMEVLGYQLIKIDRTHYDASVIARYEKLEDIVLACAEKGLDIVFYNEGELILESIE